MVDLHLLRRDGHDETFTLAVPEIEDVAWSDAGSYVALTSQEKPEIILLDQDWALGHLGRAELIYPLCPEPVCRCSKLIFAPDEKVLLVVAEMEIKSNSIREALFILDVPTLGILKRLTLDEGESVTSLSWRHKHSQVMISYASEKTVLLSVEESKITALPFKSSTCCCHPTNADLCAFVGNGRVFIANVETRALVTEHAVEDNGVMALCWSSDGSRLFAASSTGWAYTCLL
ncbi:MAG: WD40 repeat domain-containing protein [Acidobacteriota bacterium]|nr:WD40 repeat domain-containing protein [Acidobacteriota bacterium]